MTDLCAPLRYVHYLSNDPMPFATQPCVFTMASSNQKWQRCPHLLRLPCIHRHNSDQTLYTYVPVVRPVIHFLPSLYCNIKFLLFTSHIFSMTSFHNEYDKLSADWNLELTMAIYTRGSPYTSAEMDEISTTFDQLVLNLRNIFATSFNTNLWDARLNRMLAHCHRFISGLINTILQARPRASFLLPTLHIYFAALYASCVTAYFCPAE